jgi:hypothetical protein
MKLIDLVSIMCLNVTELGPVARIRSGRQERFLSNLPVRRYPMENEQT